MNINFYGFDFRYSNHTEQMLVENTICLIKFYQKRYNPTRERINSDLQNLYDLGLINKKLKLTVGGRLLEN